MKRLNKILFTILLLLPFIVLAENVSIKDIKLVEKSEYVVEKSKPTFSGLNVSFDLKFEQLGDNATYRAIIENKDNDNYFLNLTLDSDSKYIKYEVDSDESTNIIKANSDTVIYIIIKYDKEVPSYKLTNNIYTEKKNIGIKLTNNKKEEVIVDSGSKNIIENTSKRRIVVNPNTGNIVLKIKNTNIVLSLYTVIAVLLIAIIAIIVLKKLKVKRYINMLLILGLLIPGMAIAVKEINIVVTSNIEIEPVELIEFKYMVVDMMKETTKQKKYNAIKGMTFKEWLGSKYNKDNISFIEDLEDNICLEGYYYDEPLNYNNIFNHFIMTMDTHMDDNDFSYISLDAEIEEKTYLLVYTDCIAYFGIRSDDNKSKTYQFRIGMTFAEWLESEYNVDNITFDLGEYTCGTSNNFNTNQIITDETYSLRDNKICPDVID